MLRIPASLSDDAKNLIVSLLNRNPSRRLGAGPEGADEIKRHPFFKDLDWQQAINKQLQPPKPIVNTNYFSLITNNTEYTEDQMKKIFEDQND